MNASAALATPLGQLLAIKAFLALPIKSDWDRLNQNPMHKSAVPSRALPFLQP